MKALIPVLESLGVQKAVSLDDDYAPKSHEGSTPGIDDFFAAYAEQFSQEDRELIEDIGLSTIGDLFRSQSVPQPLKEQIHAILLSQEERPNALDFLEQGFVESSIQYEKISTLEQIKGVRCDKGTIWFLDEEIDDSSILAKAIPAITTRMNQGEACILVVFTNNTSRENLNGAWQNRFDFLKRELLIEDEIANRIAYSFFVISKETINDKLTYNKEAAQQYLGDILINSITGFCLHNMIVQMQKYAEQSYCNLLNIAKNADQRTIESLRYNMLTEGEPNAYHVLSAVQRLMQEQKYVAGYESCSKYILTMKRLASTLKDSEETICARTISDIMTMFDWTQFQFVHNDVNLALSDVSYGDIFELGYTLNGTNAQSYIGVLVTQPCDCVLRKTKDGKVQRKSQQLTLLLFAGKKLTKNLLENTTNKDWKALVRNIRDKGIFYTQEKDDDRNWTAEYIEVEDASTAVQVAPFILDLTSLNCDGKSSLMEEDTFDSIVRHNKVQNWLSYMGTLKGSVTKFWQTVQELQDSMGQPKAEEFLASIYGVPFSIAAQQFQIKRIGHLEDNLTELISYQYVSHAYRTGKNSLIALHNVDERGDEG